MSEAVQDVPAAVAPAPIGDELIEPDWSSAPPPQSRPARGVMRDDLAAPERRWRPPRWRARPRGPLGDELLEPDWAALAPRGRRVIIGPVGDATLAPDWRWQPPADAAALRRALIGPVGDDVLPGDWAARLPVMQLGAGPVGDNVVRPDWGAPRRRQPAARR
jgi:hypothetical protein